jgi:hypothetical protein
MLASQEAEITLWSRRGASVPRPHVDAGGSLFVVTLLVVILPIAAPSMNCSRTCAAVHAGRVNMTHVAF